MTEEAAQQIQEEIQEAVQRSEKINEIHRMITAEVDRMWDEYDTDHNGYLQRNEATVFISKMVEDMGCDYKQEEFDKCFDEMDQDQNGIIEKKEMTKFITALIGLEK